MAITFGKNGSLTDTITLEFKQIDITEETENEVIPIPNAYHYYVVLGYKGSIMECSGWIHDEANYNKMKVLTAQDVLKVTVASAAIPEFPVNTYWAITKKTLTRKGGYLMHWEYKISLMQVYSGSVTLKDGTGTLS